MPRDAQLSPLGREMVAGMAEFVSRLEADPGYLNRVARVVYRRGDRYFRVVRRPVGDRGTEGKADD